MAVDQATRRIVCLLELALATLMA